MIDRNAVMNGAMIDALLAAAAQLRMHNEQEIQIPVQCIKMAGVAAAQSFANGLVPWLIVAGDATPYLKITVSEEDDGPGCYIFTLTGKR